jgi:acyl-CoA synthetase (AMP-forming)/AMP-acid ligase II
VVSLSSVPQNGKPLDDRDLLDRLIGFADTTPDRLLYTELLDGVNESGRLTAAELRDRAAALGAALLEQGLKPGDVALLIATPPLEFLVGLLGCMWAGVLAAPIAFPRRPEHLATRLEPVRANAGAVAVVAGPPQGAAEATVLDLLTAGELPVVHTTASAPARPPYGERDIAYLQYTSGSTSDPRGVIVTHANLVANLEVARVLLGYDAESITVSWCPLTHDMGLILGALSSLMFGSRAVLMTPSAFIRRPLTWLRAVAKYRGTHGYSPNFGYDLLVDRSTPEQRAELDLSSMKSFINGAEPVRRFTRERFVAAFGDCGMQPNAHTPGYGLAEASVLVSTAPLPSSGRDVLVDAAALERDEVVIRDAAGDDVRELCLCGVAGPGYDVRIVDPATCEELPPNKVGELWLRGPSVCPGYWKREDETRAAFGATLVGDDGGPYLRTGDLAFMYDGEIVICGRSKDVIVINGRNLYPQDIELTVELAHPAVRLGGSAAFAVDDPQGKEALVVVAEVDGEPDVGEVTKAVGSAVLREFELQVMDVLLVPPQGIPKTSSGKKQRAATRRIWRDIRGREEELEPAR